jgi:acid phosphatase (class A)
MRAPAWRAVALLVALCASAAAPASAKGNAHFHYLDPSQVDLMVLLPPPPDLGSPQALADQEQVAKVIARRSPAEVATARLDASRSVFAFAPAVGPGFDAQHLPVTAGFFARISSDVKNLVDIAKSYWERPRPNGAIKRQGSYPSGHAAFAASTAIILAQLLPEKRDAIFNQARAFAENRIILGLHYPTDVAAGWTAGTLAAYVMMQDPGFARDFAAARAELQRALPLRDIH